MSPHIALMVSEYQALSAQYARWASGNPAHAECLRHAAARWALKALEVAGIEEKS